MLGVASKRTVGHGVVLRVVLVQIKQSTRREGVRTTRHKIHCKRIGTSGVRTLSFSGVAGSPKKKPRVERTSSRDGANVLGAGRFLEKSAIVSECVCKRGAFKWKKELVWLSG